MATLVKLDETDTLHKGEVYIVSATFRTDAIGARFREIVRKIIERVELKLREYPIADTKIDWMDHSNPLWSELGSPSPVRYADIWVLNDVEKGYELQMKFTLTSNPLGVWTVVSIIAAAIAFVALVVPISVSIYHVIPEMEEQAQGLLKATGTTGKVVIVGAGALALYWLYGRMT